MLYFVAGKLVIPDLLWAIKNREEPIKKTQTTAE
jgi:F0F1-type ATP synthase membrane subunit b/b'